MIIPAFDLMDQKVVRLYQGNYSKKINYDVNLYDYLQYYKDKGVKIVHLVDLNGAQSSQNRQLKFFKDIISKNFIAVQIGGGIRNIQEINDLLTLGAKRIVVGSAAVNNKNEVKKWLRRYGPDAIVLALDLHIDQNNKKEVLINGWQKNTNVTLEEILDFFSDTQLKHVLCTDISKDGTLLGPNIKLYTEISQKFQSIHFQASGGINALNDILSLKKTGVKNIIIGRSLLEKNFTIQEALKCWQNE